MSASRAVSQRSCLFPIQKEGKCMGFDVKQWPVLLCIVKVAKINVYSCVLLYNVDVRR